MKHLPYVGVSGIMSAFEARACIEEWREAWAAVGREPTHDLMLGVLASAKTLRGEVNKHPRRYPKREAIADCFVDEPGVLNLVHYASDVPPDAGTLHSLMLAAGPWCHGFQFNGAWPTWNTLTEFVRQDLQPIREGFGWRIVLQVGPRMLAEMGAGADLSFKLDPYACLATDVLIDASGGEGRAIDVVAAAMLFSFVGDQRRGFGGGIAGGLCAETLTPAVGKMLRAGCSIDAERRLRDDADGGGNLLLNRVSAYERAAVALITNSQETTP